ncbi:MAG: hypothetical protein KC422_01130 [Trueperaceae bacterium]|nr:hypothetical protein [Trueperaceae bacterium]
MTFLRQLNERLARNDFLQMSLLFFGLLVATLAFTWPASEQIANNSFFSVAQVRLMALLLLALGFGSFELKQTRRQKLASLLALLTLSLTSMAFEVATYAVSFPQVPLYWTLLLGLIDPIAYFGIGIVLGFLLGLVRLTAVLPMAILALPIGFIFLDIPLGIPLFNPLTAIGQLSLAHLFLMTVFATLTLVYLLSPRKNAKL